MTTTRSPGPAKKAAAKKTATPKRPTRNRSPWATADLVALKISGEVAAYMESRGFAVPDCPPLWKTPEPNRVRGTRFYAPAVDHVIASFRQLRHTKGRFAGQIFEPDAWQVAYALAPWAGWQIKSPDSGDWVRIITTLYIELPRKNGKTTLAGGIALYMVGADGEHGAQVLTAATTKDQANLCFDPMRQLVVRSGLRAYLKPFKAKIVHSASGSYFQSIAHAGDAQHGADIHCGIVDELHLHKEMSLIDALETGTGSRTQPLILLITTADSGKRHTPYDSKRSRIEKLARGVLKDPTTYGVVFAAEKEDDPFIQKTWRKANPGFGISPTIRFMTDEAAKAAESPAEKARFLRLHLGIRTKQESRYLDVENWDINAGIVVPERLKGKLCYGGLDLGSTSDLTALVWVFPDNDAGAYDVLARFWTPEDNLDALDDRTAKAASTDWVKNGWLRTTPGNVTDYDFIKTQIDADLDEYEVGELSYDPWNAQQLVNDLINDGAPMVKMRQGFLSMSAPTKDLQRLINLGAIVDDKGVPVKPIIRHGGNPVLRWMVDNFAVTMDPAANVKPDKVNAGDKIDGVVALTMGLSRAIANQDTSEVWGVWM